MALTPEQQEQLDMQLAIIDAQKNSQLAVQSKQTKIEAVRLAKETLIENSRNKPVADRDITGEDIINFANTLIAYVES